MSGTTTGGTIHSARRNFRKAMLLLFAAEGHGPSVTGGCHGKRGDHRPYADVSLIARDKARNNRARQECAGETSVDLLARKKKQTMAIAGEAAHAAL
jgi:hypothetical protein